MNFIAGKFNGELCTINRALVAVIYYNIFSAILAYAAIGIFYTNAFRLDWMPMEYKNKLGYSFWLEVACAVMLTLVTMFMFLATAFKSLRSPYEKGFTHDPGDRH